MQRKRCNSESASSTLELVAAILLLTAPMPLCLELFEIQSNQLLAENIARHALRGAVLEGKSLNEYQLSADRIASEIQQAWNSQLIAKLTLECQSPCQKGSTLSLIVRFGRSLAVQSQVLDR